MEPVAIVRARTAMATAIASVVAKTVSRETCTAAPSATRAMTTTAATASPITMHSGSLAAAGVGNDNATHTSTGQPRIAACDRATPPANRTGPGRRLQMLLHRAADS